VAETPDDKQGQATTAGEAAAASVNPGSAHAAVSRQKFLTGATVALGGLMGVIIAVPVTVAVLAPSFETIKEYPIDVGPTKLYPPAKQGEVAYHEVTVENRPDDISGLSRRLVFIRNDGDDKFTAISNTCMHLGCPVQPNPSGFSCPCHGGQYDKEGRRIAGPPVRPLNRYATSVSDKGHLILGELYALDDSLKRHQLKGPGQPVDGILSYLYPDAPQG
jgi:menaquinol-cytochrome c reductase iron-sulfur subunit